MSEAQELQFEVSPDAGSVSALWLRPQGARAALALAHGAGAGMRHAFMEAAAAALAARGIATLRYQFPYMEAGKQRIDSRAKLHATVHAAARQTVKLARDLPVFVGGKSMGGRMTSQALSEAPLEEVGGIVFFGFPLHPAGKPGVERADHLSDVTLPMCFLQGTRDKLADLELLGPVVKALGARGTLHVIEGADHGFSVLKRSGRTGEDVLAEICSLAADFVTA